MIQKTIFYMLLWVIINKLFISIKAQILDFYYYMIEYFKMVKNGNNVNYLNHLECQNKLPIF